MSDMAQRIFDTVDRLRRPRIFIKLVKEEETIEVSLENFPFADVVIITSREHHEKTLLEGDTLALIFPKEK